MSDPEAWEHLNEQDIVWDYGPVDLSTHLDARIKCCNLELRVLPGQRAVCSLCQRVYGIGFIRAVLLKRDSGPGFLNQN